MGFVRATKTRAKLRMAISGPSGSGKTYSALAVASGLTDKIAVIDTERGSASKYADLFAFDVVELTHFAPTRYIEAIREAEAAGYEALVIDSLSHAWNGIGGVLEIVDAQARGGNTFAAWAKGTPEQNKFIQAVISANLHVIVTMRTKTEFVLEKDDKGKVVPHKVGITTIQREGVEYEFDVAGFMDYEHTFTIDKTRCPALDRAVIHKPGRELAATLAAWLGQGAQPSAPVALPEGWKLFADYRATGISRLEGTQRAAVEALTPERWSATRPEKQAAIMAALTQDDRSARVAAKVAARTAQTTVADPAPTPPPVEAPEPDQRVVDAAFEASEPEGI